MAGSFVLEIGVVIFLAFLGAYLAGRFRQSVIVGYILVGIFIGPNIHLSLYGLRYDGLVSNEEFIQQLSRFGLMFLLFFTGLGFSVSALKTTWKPAVLLAVSDVLLNMYIGFIIGSLFGWPLPDTIFLAAIIGMSSVAVAAKSAEEGHRLYRKEFNYLFSAMIVEDFITILLLTFASAFVLGNILGPEKIMNMSIGVVIIYAFFFVLALFIAPKAFHYFERIQGNELFVLFSLSIVFLSSAFADYLGIPSAIGAFLVGMAFAETRLKEQLQAQMLSMKDAFVAIFFVSFGMLVNPSVFLQVVPMLALAIPLVMVNEVFILGCLSYFMGFTRRAAISIGTGFLGRGEDAVLFASVGSGLQNPATGEPVLVRSNEINPFAGAFCFVMSAITPAMMRFAFSISDGLARLLPESFKFGGTLVARTLKGAIISSGFAPTGLEKRLLAALVAYGAVCGAAMATSGLLHIGLAAAGLALLLYAWKTFSAYLGPRAASVDLQDLNVLRPDRGAVRRYTAGVVMMVLSLVLVVTALWAYSWRLVVAVNMLLLLSIMAYMSYIHVALKVKPPPVKKEHILHLGSPAPGKAVDPYFGPHRTPARASRPVRTPGARPAYRPVPKEALLPGPRARAEGRAGGLRSAGPR